MPLVSDVGPVLSEVTEGKSPVPVLTEGGSPVPVLTEGKSPVPSRAVEAIGYKILSIYLLSHSHISHSTPTQPTSSG